MTTKEETNPKGAYTVRFGTKERLKKIKHDYDLIDARRVINGKAKGSFNAFIVEAVKTYMSAITMDSKELKP